MARLLGNLLALAAVWWRSDPRRCDRGVQPKKMQVGSESISAMRGVEVGGGIDVVVSVPSAVAVSPVERPAAAAGLVAELGDVPADPLDGRVRPLRPAVRDRDRVAADGRLEAHLVAAFRRRAVLAEAMDLGEREIGDGGGLSPAAVDAAVARRLGPARR
jgi:hypothetical protein